MADFKSRENRAFAYEIKYALPTELAREVRAWARAHMQRDPNTASGSGDVYRITSLYYDTYGFDVYHHRGSFGRAKYRVRRYDSCDRAFLERKLRTRSVVTKRRTLVDIDELDRLGEMEPDRSWAGAWFHARMLGRAMHPACQVSYSRTALVSETGAGLARLTLDEDLRAWRVSRPEYAPLAGGAPIFPGRTILEMKFRMAVPSLFKQIVEEFGLEAETISKYKLAVTGLGCAPLPRPSKAIGVVQAEVACA